MDSECKDIEKSFYKEQKLDMKDFIREYMNKRVQYHTY